MRKFKYFFAALSVILPFSLGIWQIYRLEIKRELIAQIENNIHASPKYIMDNVTKKEEFVPVKLRCVLDVISTKINHKNILLYNPQIYRDKTGFSLITPCKLEDGRVILIDRGFVFGDMSIAIEEEVIGAIIFPRSPSYFMPNNDIMNNIWFSINIKDAEKFFRVKLEPYYVKMTRESNTFPIREKFHPNIPNNHLGYAITWFSMAGIILLIFAFRLR
jgi:surfeit locus 1 family protein